MIPAFVPAQSFTAPEIHWLTLAPMLIVFGGALIGVLIEAFAPRARRHELEVPLTMATLVAALVVLIGFTRGAQRSTIGGAVVVDGVAAGPVHGCERVERPRPFFRDGDVPAAVQDRERVRRGGAGFDAVDEAAGLRREPAEGSAGEGNRHGDSWFRVVAGPQ